MKLNETQQAVINDIIQRWRRSSTGFWKLNTADNIGEDWLICSLGHGWDGNDYIVTTDRVRASEYDGDAKDDGECIVSAKKDLESLLGIISQLVTTSTEGE